MYNHYALRKFLFQPNYGGLLNSLYALFIWFNLKVFRSGSKEEMFFEFSTLVGILIVKITSVSMVIVYVTDLTPSSGNTPIHHKSTIDTPHLDKIVYTDSTPMPNSLPEPSPTDMKKQLIELFRESFGDGCSDGDQNLHGQQEAKPTVFDLPPKSRYELVPNSVCSSERTPYRETYSRKGKSSQYSQCCIPSLMRSLSFTERKKGLSSPVLEDGK
ncbi:hypothetical protein Patl1_16917 [Pistacia atlantica]|uniref:Uncharacterized protein n=1 Tax=Pistacia atlantica TaxID=434234 RepID=A0ACC1B6E3_9ROSI|nr:hypothetical protein Patl1_16917 [Pistacia atlantica]